jgi:hypothetical protein
MKQCIGLTLAAAVFVLFAGSISAQQVRTAELSSSRSAAHVQIVKKRHKRKHHHHNTNRV